MVEFWADFRRLCRCYVSYKSFLEDSPGCTMFAHCLYVRFTLEILDLCWPDLDQPSASHSTHSVGTQSPHRMRPHARQTPVKAKLANLRNPRETLVSIRSQHSVEDGSPRRRKMLVIFPIDPG